MKTEPTACFHCGEDCTAEVIRLNEKHFCCEGCKTVYEILAQGGLCEYYEINKAPGISFTTKNTDNRFEYLDDKAVVQKLINFSDGKKYTVTFLLPQIHCSSCIWLLENLYKLKKGIIKSRVDFLRKEVFIVFNESDISLKQLVILLSRIGYEPQVTMGSAGGQLPNKLQTRYYFKLGIAFFCFGNIMLLSFPEYFGISSVYESSYKSFFGYLNFILALPVLLYSASEFFLSAYIGIKRKNLNMDFPIALGIAVMFLQSSVDIFLRNGIGYMDTMAGLVFLMLVGRMFQQKTYETISFDRNYKSYFPISVNKLEGGVEKNISIDKLTVGDKLVVRNEELVPADAILVRGVAQIDYSFVTGESQPVSVSVGDIIYAGGKQIGGMVELNVIKEVSQSYLTELWNDDAFAKNKEADVTSLANKVSKYFTIIILIIALGAAFFWIRSDWQRALYAFTSVLIITCPCALALSSPFTMGNALRYLGIMKIYVKNGLVLERLANISTVVFDKTGTITKNQHAVVTYEGEMLTPNEKEYIYSLAKQSSHPLSKKVAQYLTNINPVVLTSVKEIPGKGVEGYYDNTVIKIGSYEYICGGNQKKKENLASQVHISVKNVHKGCYNIKNNYRKGLKEIIEELAGNKKLALISGDNDAEKNYLQTIFSEKNILLFNQTPSNKLDFVKTLHTEGEKVVMIGDGLNDAGALKQSDVGIAVTDNSNNFSPACDIILDASKFDKIPSLLRYAKFCLNIIKASFILSFLYNVVGIYFAVTGTLSPLIAAILMPISSVTIILFTTIATRLSFQSIMAR